MAQKVNFELENDNNDAEDSSFNSEKSSVNVNIKNVSGARAEYINFARIRK